MILMSIIGLLIVAGALFFNLKAYPNVFMSKKKRAEAETKFAEALEKMEDTGLGQQMTEGVMGATFAISTFINFLFYLITAIIASNPFMFVLAGAIVILNAVLTKQGLKAVREKSLPKTNINKLNLPLKTAYIIGFIALVLI